MTTKRSAALWDQLVSEHSSLSSAHAAKDEFFGTQMDRVAMLRNALRMPDGNNRSTAVSLLGRMTSFEQQQLLPELIQLARSAHGPVSFVRKIIASLQREVVLPQIDAEVARLGCQAEYDDYWMLIELLIELDHDRAVKLAQCAAASDDVDIRELGIDKLAVLRRDGQA